ncbi:hypothetical protein EGH23_19335 [Halomicroarcula sp. F27]|uniref:Uncharacterized protein n=1 Tax=Haloarcula nitratireducens TaxID=2487749 RepID=A0AAW4PIC2_9EURY|nr:hypothetical protein [Halomicroarcula nitratireducens]
MHLDHVYASAALVEEARDQEELQVVVEPAPIAFEDGQFAAPSPTER